MQKDAREEFEKAMKHKHWLEMVQKVLYVLFTIACFAILCILSYLYILN